VSPDADFRYAKGTLRARERPHWRSTNRRRSFDPQCLRNRLSAAVAAQIGAARGRRIAVLLSGGIDSTIIAHEAAMRGVREAWTIAVHEEAPDALAARTVAERLGLHWHLVITEPLDPEIGIVTGETSNRSIVEEISVQIRLLRILARSGVHIVLTGTGADEVFVGYSHLFGRVHPTEMQQRFVSSHYRFDLRAFNKAAMGFAVEPRNPFLHRDVVNFAKQLHADLLLWPRREMKWPLRIAYQDILDHAQKAGKLVARETMGAKSWFVSDLPCSPLVFRKWFTEILSSPSITREWISRAQSSPLLSDEPTETP
jgi:asparagine synthetase B (glutamine-hydrolysing)